MIEPLIRLRLGIFVGRKDLYNPVYEDKAGKT